MGVIRVNCHNLWKPFVAISASTLFSPFPRDSIAATRPPKKSPKTPRYRTASSAIARVPVGDAVFLHRLLKAAPSTCICRLPEPSRAHSRDQHVQTREAAKPSKDSRGICLTQKCVAFNEVNPQKSLKPLTRFASLRGGTTKQSRQKVDGKVSNLNSGLKLHP